MTSTTRRLDPVSMVALVVAMLALLAAGAGVGYAAATVGTSDLKNKAVTAKKIKNNAVTTKKIKNNAVNSAKVKDGSLAVADLVPEEKQIAAALSNGGEGDCAWSTGSATILGVGLPTFRKDRFGRVHMTGYAVRTDAPGGDGACDGTGPGQVNDHIAFTLPAGYIPAKTTLAGFGELVIVLVGAQGITTPGLSLPPGTALLLSTGDEVIFDNVSFDPAGSDVVIPKMAASGRLTEEIVSSLGPS